MSDSPALRSPPSESSSTFDSPTTSAPSSSSFDSPSTAFTSPSSGDGKEWSRDQAYDRVQETLSAPTGFVYLDQDYAREVGASVAARSFDWRVEMDSINSRKVLKRRLGPTEVSYYLGSRGQGSLGGVNDMYLHIGFSAPSGLVTAERILEVWKTILSRHTLLWSTVKFEDYYNIHFFNRVPRDSAEFDDIVRARMEIKIGLHPKGEGRNILNDYLNGERTLSDERLAHLVVSTPEESLSSKNGENQEYDFFLYSTHFLGDGMALHSTANEFFTLLSDPNFAPPASPPSDSPNLSLLPPALESKVATSKEWGKTAWSAAKTDFKRNEAKNLGGQSFPRASLGTRHTLVPTVSYSSTDSSKILQTCKQNSSTIASALFALSNLAYIRSTPSDQLNKRLPTNLYSALNVRGFLEEEPGRDEYHIAIGYYNIILPSFYPSSIPVPQYFWHQASSVRKQTSRVVKSRFLKSRTLLMGFERERRSIGFERADEEKNGVREGMKGLGITDLTEEKVEKVGEEVEVKREEGKMTEKVPNVSLMGLSMLGNLDGIYQHALYEIKGIKLHTLTTGSRQRSSSLLLFSYTFSGKLWISLGYDSNGFERGVIESWWKQLLMGVDELLLNDGK
ncbi:hypothetical protein JCM5353_007284 [Sporobolomyces roseus]